MRVVRPDERERKLRAAGALMKATLGDKVDEMIRDLFAEQDMLDMYERARADMIAAGGDPNDPTLWRAILEGMSWRAQQFNARERISGYRTARMS